MRGGVRKGAGRPPIGKEAMSGSERQRRYLDRLLKRDPSATELELTKELKKARARIAELEKALAAAQRNPSSRAQKRASLRT